MKTYYFLATVTNATAPAVRVLSASKVEIEAFADAARVLAGYGFYVSSMQELTFDRYFAPNVAPICYDGSVQVRPVAPIGSLSPEDAANLDGFGSADLLEAYASEAKNGGAPEAFVSYALSKTLAMRARAKGEIAEALRHEHNCEVDYADLPPAWRW